MYLEELLHRVRVCRVDLVHPVPGPLVELLAHLMFIVSVSESNLKDHKKLSKDVSAVSTRLSALDQGVAKKVSELSTTASELQSTVSELTESANKAEKNLTITRMEMAVMERNTIDRETLQQELSNEQQNWENKLTLLAEELDKKLKLIRGDLKKLEMEIEKVRKLKVSRPPAPASGTAKPPPGKTEQLPPGGIIEKDLN